MPHRPWRVLVVDHDRYFYGSQQYLFRQAPGLEQRGVELILAGPADGDLARTWRDSGRRHVALESADDRALLTATGRASPLRVLREGVRILRGAWRTARLARQVDADVLDANSFGWAFNEVVLAGWLLRRPTVVHVHMQVEPSPVRWARAAAVRGATVSVGVSHAVAHSLPGWARSRLRVVPSGIDTDQFRPGPADPGARAELTAEPDAPVVLVVARLVPAKGIADVIAAIADLPPRLDRTRLAIAGGAPDPAHEAALRELGRERLGDRIRFLGNRSDVVRLLRAADALVLAADADAEGLPLCLLEAHACGTPTASYPAGGVAELIEHGVTGLIVRQGDIADLSHQIARLLDEPGLAESLADAALRRVRAERTLQAQVQAQADLLHALRR